MFLSTNLMAYDVPEDAVIKVYTKSGKQIGQMSRQEYKVVKLGTSNCPQPPAQPEKQVVVKYEKKLVKHEVLLHGGMGYTNLSMSYSTGKFHVSENYGMVLGMTYCHNLTDLGLCGTILTNRTGLMGVKFGF
jgi:hypothetical protein